MKTVSKTLVTAFAVSLMASAAHASYQQERIGEESVAYFRQAGNSTASGSGKVMKNADYDRAATPQERNAMRDDAYWATVNHSNNEPASGYMSGISVSRIKK